MQEMLQICSFIRSFPCTSDTWIFRASFSDWSPCKKLSFFLRTKFKEVPEKRACVMTDLAETGNYGLNPSLSIMPLGLQPSFPILLSRVFLMDWGGGGSGELEAELPKSIPTYRMVQILSVHPINKQQSWKKRKILFLTAAHSLYLSLSK